MSYFYSVLNYNSACMYVDCVCVYICICVQVHNSINVYVIGTVVVKNCGTDKIELSIYSA